MILQELIHKQLDIRVTVVGSSVFATEIHSQNEPESRFDWRAGTVAGQNHAPHELPESLRRKCIRLTHSLGLAYSAIDFVLDANGDYFFLEVNPNGEWAWNETRVGFPIADTFVDLFCSLADQSCVQQAQKGSDFNACP